MALIAVDPGPTPFTCGCEAGDVAPAEMNTLCVTVAFDVSPLVRLTVTPPAGAATDKVTWNTADCPIVIVVLDGRRIAPAAVTVTPAIALGIPGALAVMVANPGAAPVTGTVAEVAFAPKVTLGGTVAALVLFELRFTVRPPAGAGADKVSVRFCVPVPAIVRLGGEKLSVNPPDPTCTS